MSQKKYIIVIGDGMADNPVPELGGKTPLEHSNIPLMDSLSQRGELGTVKTVPDGLVPGTDTAMLSIFGYDPRRYYSGRSPFEAAGSGVTLADGDVSYRCNIISMEDVEKPFSKKKILSHSGGAIDGESSIALMKYLLADADFMACVKTFGMDFHLNPSFRHIAVQKGADIDGLICAPPHNHLGEVVESLLPHGCKVAEGLNVMMEKANAILDQHPINVARRAAGKLPANGVWFWAEGTAMALPSFTERHKKKGVVISAVPLIWGIGALSGIPHKLVPGATGDLDTNFEGKADYLLAGLDEGADFGLVHLEAPDECTHNGDLKGKIQAIEWLDSRLLSRLLEGLDKRGYEYRMLVLADHKTLTSTRGHDGEPVPYILYDSKKHGGAVGEKMGSGLVYNERNGEEGLYIEDGTTLILRLFES